MPVKKFKSFEDAEKDLWNFHPDEKYFRKVFDMLNFGLSKIKRNLKRGIILKFKSIEDAQENNLEKYKNLK